MGHSLQVCVVEVCVQEEEKMLYLVLVGWHSSYNTQDSSGVIALCNVSAYRLLKCNYEQF